MGVKSKLEFKKKDGHLDKMGCLLLVYYNSSIITIYLEHNITVYYNKNIIIYY